MCLKRNCGFIQKAHQIYEQLRGQGIEVALEG